ncbi:MAG TPA: hypothetical protein VE403_06490, partial [Sphingomicrobium sp.]|nr:hypothetical protein [Sphingomicrobium sp.]
MTAIRALSAAGLLLLAASSASAQDADGTPPDRGSAAAGTAPAPVQPGIRVAPPKLDPKLLIDVFK